MWQYNYSGELYHHGIKGMKWGVRRYQNKDGSLTNAGKKRMYKEMFDSESKERKEQKKYTADTHRWVKEDTERTKRLVDSTRTMNNELKNANRYASEKAKAKSKVKMDLSDMTDKEMREQINRALLEKQYNDMFAPHKVSKGREFATDALEVAGSVLAITSSALGIALAIKDLKG